MKKEIAIYILAALVLIGVVVRTELDIQAISSENTVLSRIALRHKVCVTKPHGRVSCHYEY